MFLREKHPGSSALWYLISAIKLSESKFYYCGTFIRCMFLFPFVFSTRCIFLNYYCYFFFRLIALRYEHVIINAKNKKQK